MKRIEEPFKPERGETVEEVKRKISRLERELKRRTGDASRKKSKSGT